MTLLEGLPQKADPALPGKPAAMYVNQVPYARVYNEVTLKVLQCKQVM